MRVTETTPTVVAVSPGSVAEREGILARDEILSVNGLVPRDVIEWRMLTDSAAVEIEINRGGLSIEFSIEKADGEALGVEISSAVFDRVRTCDNHCPFCFIYQLPPGMRKSLYLKDDDYRLSFLYGNFTTLTRFTEADLERILVDGLSPLNVSIHATDPALRTTLLRNARGAVSLRWLKQLLQHGVRVNGQIVVCPGVNDGVALNDTLTGILDDFPELNSVAVVPLGISSFNSESTMRAHSPDEAGRVVDIVENWQVTFREVLGRPVVFAADEYYIMAGRAFPPADAYSSFDLHEDGIGMARAFELEFNGSKSSPNGTESGFFAWVDGAPAQGYRAPRNPAGDTALRQSSCSEQTQGRTQSVTLRTRPHSTSRSIGILTGEYGAVVLRPLIESLDRRDIRVIPVRNTFFGGNIAVTGLLVGHDIARALRNEPPFDRYLLPDVCLSDGRFLDGTTVGDLPVPVEIVPTDGIALRRVLES